MVKKFMLLLLVSSILLHGTGWVSGNNSNAGILSQVEESSELLQNSMLDQAPIVDIHGDSGEFFYDYEQASSSGESNQLTLTWNHTPNLIMRANIPIQKMTYRLV